MIANGMMNLILWSVFMTGSKTPGMSDKRDVINFTKSDKIRVCIHFST